MVGEPERIMRKFEKPFYDNLSPPWPHHTAHPRKSWEKRAKSSQNVAKMPQNLANFLRKSPDFATKLAHNNPLCSQDKPKVIAQNTL